MSFFERMITVLKANLNALIGKAEDPRKLIEQSLEDMQKKMQRAKEDVVNAVADEKKLRAELEKEQNEASEWEKRAMLAVQQGRDDLASQALARQAEHAQSATKLHDAWGRHKSETEALKQALREMNDHIEELRRKKNMLLARHTRAQAQERIQATMTSMKDPTSTDTFRRMEAKIEDMEAKAAAAAELGAELQGVDLEKQFQALEAGTPDQRLLALKRKMGVLAADGTAPRQLNAPRVVDSPEPAVVVSDTRSKRA
jgi:phage shock protein A